MFRKLFLTLAAILLIGMASAAFAQPAVVMINEVLYDTQGTDDPNLLFTELWGPSGTNLSGWTLQGRNGNGGAIYRTVTLTGSIPASGYYVIANHASVLNATQVLNTDTGGVDWQNAGSTSGADCDGLELYDASNTLIDHVCYGDCASGHVCNGEGGTNAPDYNPPSSGPNESLARMPDHQDTNDNAADFQNLNPPTPGAPNTGEPCDPQYVALNDIRQHDASWIPSLEGQPVVVRGIVNVNNFSIDTTYRSNFFFQDDDAGCNVFGGSVPLGLVVGDCVVVSGWVDQYNGLTEIVSTGTGNCSFRVQKVDSNQTVSPNLISCASAFEAFEGMLVRINNVTIVSGTWPAQGQFGNLVITDGNGTIGLSVNEHTNVDGSPQPSGAFDIIGILQQYDTTPPYSDYYEIMPRSTADVLTGSAANDQNNPGLAQEFKLVGTYPNPFNSTAQIRFEVGTANALTLSIFNIVGQEVTHEILSGLTPGQHTYTWNPSGSTGLYFVRLQGASNVETAKMLYLK